jgi:hypothetical protein
MFPTRHALRTTRAKFVETVEDGERELFDLPKALASAGTCSRPARALAKALGERLVAARDPLWRSDDGLRVVGAGGYRRHPKRRQRELLRHPRSRR